jgi:hypothetical protein
MADEKGCVRQGIEGRPLTAQYIAGRGRVDGSDIPIPASEFDALATALTGQSPLGLPQKLLPSKAVGTFGAAKNNCGLKTQEVFRPGH